MTHSKVLAPPPAREPGSDAPPSVRRPFSPLAVALVLAALTAVFFVPLRALLTFAGSHSLYSHIPLIPLLCAYLIWMQRNRLPARTPGLGPWTVVAATIGLAVIGAYGLLRYNGVPMAPETALAFTTTSFCALVVAVLSGMLGNAFARTNAFALGFLVFAIPLPESWLEAVETVLQHGSAGVAHTLFRIVGTSVFYHDLTFQLPGISLFVAPECSGIHSTVALFMVSLVAGHFFLRSKLRAAILAAFVFPLALLRNGFRVFVIGELCVRKGPAMLDSPIHHHGGPFFFALSLVPFALALWLLARSDRRATATATR